MITSERVNIWGWNLGVDVLYKNLSRVRIWGNSPLGAQMFDFVFFHNVAFGYDVGKIAGCLVYKYFHILKSWHIIVCDAQFNAGLANLQLWCSGAFGHKYEPITFWDQKVTVLTRPNLVKKGEAYACAAASRILSRSLQTPSWLNPTITCRNNNCHNDSTWSMLFVAPVMKCVLRLGLYSIMPEAKRNCRTTVSLIEFEGQLHSKRRHVQREDNYYSCQFVGSQACFHFQGPKTVAVIFSGFTMHL